MEEYLECFVDCINNDNKRLSMNTEMLVVDAFQQKMNVADFSCKLDPKFSFEHTGIFLCDFEKARLKDICSIIDNYNGIYKTQVSLNENMENNVIYAVFQTPIDAYSFLSNTI
jgi:hypothetical protein